MVYEFVLLALINANAPMALQRYDHMEDCQEDASNLSSYVGLNYTELKYDSEPVKERLMQMLATYNARWEAIQIPVPTPAEVELPTVSWVPSLISNIANVIKIGEGYDLPELVVEAKTIEIFAIEMLENAERPNVPNATAPEYMLDKTEITYKCVAAPKG